MPQLKMAMSQLKISLIVAAAGLMAACNTAPKFKDTEGRKNLIITSEIEGSLLTSEDIYVRIYEYDRDPVCSWHDRGYVKLDKNERGEYHLKDAKNYQIDYAYYEKAPLANSSQEKIYRTYLKMDAGDVYELQYLQDGTGNLFKIWKIKNGQRVKTYSLPFKSICPPYKGKD